MIKNIKITPLGGVGETGALNCMLYQTGQSTILVDCGVSFADDRQHPGVDVIIPDFDFVEPFRDSIKAVVLTHGHEDHIGAVPYFLKRFLVPVYATEFTCGLLRGKLTEFDIPNVDIREISFNERFQIEDFKIEPIFVNHSMLDVTALLISNGQHKVLHLPDFKIDRTAPDDALINLSRFKEIGEEGLDLLMMDSTNSLVSGWTTSESSVREGLLECIKKIEGRIIACLFSSNAFRLQSLIDCARATGRKLALTGRSTKEYVRVALLTNRLNLTGVEVYDVEEMDQFEDSQVMVIATGSQGEPRSVLYRMSRNMFRPFRIKEDDTILMSSKMIPGNEGRILQMLDQLTILGARIINREVDPSIHSSGHAKQDELREIFRLTRPKYFMPIHGAYRHLKKHAEIAQEEGLPKEKCVVACNGDTVEVSSQAVKIIDSKEVGRVFISENTNFEITAEAIKRRKKLAWNGLVVVSILFHSKTRRVKDFQLFSEGVFGGDVESGSLRKLAGYFDALFLEPVESKQHGLTQLAKIEVRKFFKQHYQIRPEVVVLVHEV